MKKFVVALMVLAAAGANADEVFKFIDCYGTGLKFEKKDPTSTDDARLTANIRFQGAIRENDGSYRLTKYQGYIETMDGDRLYTLAVAKGKEVDGREYTEARSEKYKDHLVFEVEFGTETVQLLHPIELKQHQEQEMVLKLERGYAHVKCNTPTKP